MAIIKESKFSLRWFILFLAVIGLIEIWEELILEEVSIFESGTVSLIGFFVSALISLAMLYIGISFNRLIVTKSGALVGFFWVVLVFSISAFLYEVSIDSSLMSAGVIVWVLISVLINVYIIRSISRLSRESVASV